MSVLVQKVLSKLISKRMTRLIRFFLENQKHSALSICERHPNEWLLWTGSFSESKTIVNQTERLLNLIWLTYLLLSLCPNRNEATAVTVLCCILKTPRLNQRRNWLVVHMTNCNQRYEFCCIWINLWMKCVTIIWYSLQILYIVKTNIYLCK